MNQQHSPSSDILWLIASIDVLIEDPAEITGLEAGGGTHAQEEFATVSGGTEAGEAVGQKTRLVLFSGAREPEVSCRVGGEEE